MKTNRQQEILDITCDYNIFELAEMYLDLLDDIHNIYEALDGAVDIDEVVEAYLEDQ